MCHQARRLLPVGPFGAQQRRSTPGGLLCALSPRSPHPAVELDERCYTPDQVVGFHVTPHGARLPVVTTICFVCSHEAPVNGAGVEAARIGGDSRYGHETYHTACLDD